VSGDASVRPVIAFDTATTVAVVGLGSADGRLLEAASWSAGYRHGEELLVRIDALLATAATELAGLGGVIVGTGPGAFTGLRVGLATAKGLAHGLGIPIVGVRTSAALQAAARSVAVAAVSGGGRPVNGDEARSDAGAAVALLLPAGPSDRVLVAPDGTTSLVRAGDEPTIEPGWLLAAVDLDGRAPDDAVALGRRARAGLAAALVEAGAARLAAGEPDDLAGLVPEYVTLPRGVRAETGAVAWSRDPS